jgi:hypothetical protein
MDKQKQMQTEELIGIIQGAVGGCATHWASLIAEEVLKYYQPKIPENAVVLMDDELNEVMDTCKVSMIVTDDDGEKYISLDDHNEYTERLGKLVRQRKARIEYLEKLLDDRCDRCIERERKETAEKFAKESKQRLKGKLHRGKALHTTVFGKEYVRRIFKEVIDEVYNEITEGKV